MDIDYLAAYGTLRVNQPLWHVSTRACPYLGTFRVPGFSLYTNGLFPYAVRSDESIVVDLFQVNHRVLYICDQIEGYPDHYDRKRIIIPYVKVHPWIYFSRDFLEISHYPKVMDGDWLSRSIVRPIDGIDYDE